MRILTALAEDPYPIGILELSQRVQLSAGSTHRIVSTLVGVGWIEQNSRTSKYRLGTRILGVGTTGLLGNPVVHHGMRYLSRLSQRTGHDALLSTLVGTRVVHLARAAGALTRRTEFEPGLSQPAHTMADGKLLLAYLPEEERRYVYQVGGLSRFTANTIVDIETMERELAQIRSRGYAVDNCERFEDGRGVAVPVFGPDEQPALAMLCVGDLASNPEEDLALATQMLSLSRELTDHLVRIGDMPGVIDGAGR